VETPPIGGVIDTHFHSLNWKMLAGGLLPHTCAFLFLVETSHLLGIGECALVLHKADGYKSILHAETGPDRTEAGQFPFFGRKAAASTTTTTTTTTHNIAKSRAGRAIGMTGNSVGDLKAFVVALCLYSCAVIGLFTAFSFLRKWFPIVYARNLDLKEGITHVKPDFHPDASFFGWMQDSWSVSTSEAADAIGLDSAMLIEFANLSSTIMWRIGCVVLPVLAPLHLFFGGHVAKQDHMSYLSMGNVRNGSPLYWVHAVVVWVVIIIVERTVWAAQEKFLPLRFKWLRRLAEPQSTTVLVEAIPRKYRSDEELEKFFIKMLGKDKIKASTVVKKTFRLKAMCDRKEAAQAQLKELEARWELAGRDPAKRPKTTLRNDAINIHEEEISSLTERIQQERDRIKSQAQTVCGVNSHTGFITFKNRSDAEIALSLQYMHDEEEMVVSIPPQPVAILWHDLQVDEHASTVETLIGYLVIGMLYFGYLPIVLLISRVAQTFKMGPFQSVWDGVAPGLGLNVMVSFLPMLLMTIFTSCFILYDKNRAQHKLQIWYFGFNVTFVILVTSIGKNLMEFVMTAVTETWALPMVFGRTMPGATHFYCNFIVLQWFTHAMNLCRHTNLLKFIAFRKLYDEKDASDMAEPEDQAYYGIGSRNARHVTNLLIGIVFCTLCPPITILVWINFFVCRLVYGYLIVFAETKKPDLGGDFWVTSLRHIYAGLLIYVALMCGVLYGRAANGKPATLAGVAFLYTFRSYYRFSLGFTWKKLPFSEIVDEEFFPGGKDEVEYVQPEMLGS